MAQSSTSSSCYLPNPWTIRVKDFVTIELTDANIRKCYPDWQKTMLSFIEMQDMEGFLNDRINPPPPPEKIPTPATSTDQGVLDHQNEGALTSGYQIDNPDFKAWKRSDILLSSWILATISAGDALNQQLSDCTTATDLWQKLKDIYGQKCRPDEEHKEKMEQIKHYLPLHRAAIDGNWVAADSFLQNEQEAVRAKITYESETALMVAVRSSKPKRKEFVEKLLDLMTTDDVLLTNYFNWNALHLSAMLGNLEAAKLLVRKNAKLPNICVNLQAPRPPPITYAALVGNREMVEYLLSVTKEFECDESSKDMLRENLTRLLICAGFSDIALKMIHQYPRLACNSCSPLQFLATKSSTFRSGARLSFWQDCIYPFIPLNLEDLTNQKKRGDMESQADHLVPAWPSILWKVYAVLWKAAERFVPQIEHIKEKKLNHHAGRMLLKQLCSKIGDLDASNIRPVLEPSIQNAIFYGIKEVVEEIVASFPDAVNFDMGEKKHNIFHLAIINRCEKVFNLIYQLGDYKRLMIQCPDKDGNTSLHLVGSLSPQQLPKVKAAIATPALQMQRELQWFKEVKKLIKSDENKKNNQNRIAAELFTESHAELMEKGESWMKDTANSCSIVAALIVTIVFAAAITVPGGNNGDNGYPIFDDSTFTIFAISDGLAFFTSVSSLVIFLSILTARFAEEDFLYTLPRRLIFGFITLFLSIISMMVAFGSTAFLVLGRRKIWALAPIATLGCLPVTLFVFLQFPLLWIMIKATYFSRTFGHQSERLLY